MFEPVTFPVIRTQGGNHLNLGANKGVLYTHEPSRCIFHLQRPLCPDIEITAMEQVGIIAASCTEFTEHPQQIQALADSIDPTQEDIDALDPGFGHDLLLNATTPSPFQ